LISDLGQLNFLSMSAALPSLSASAQVVLAALSQLSLEDKTIITSWLHTELLNEAFPQWEMDIVNERLSRMDQGLSIPIPWEEVKAQLDAKWGRKP